MISVSSAFRWAGDKVTDALFGDITMRLEQAGAAWEGVVHSLAPRRTGYLISQETYRVEGRTLVLIMGAPYDIFQEFGTRNIPPHPHVRPAMEAIGRVFGSGIVMDFNRPGGSQWHGIHATGGMTVVPRGLSGRQVAHVREHVAPGIRRLHKGNVKRAKMVVRRFD